MVKDKYLKPTMGKETNRNYSPMPQLSIAYIKRNFDARLLHKWA
jgi:hypothetical protein